MGLVLYLVPAPQCIHQVAVCNLASIALPKFVKTPSAADADGPPQSSRWPETVVEGERFFDLDGLRRVTQAIATLTCPFPCAILRDGCVLVLSLVLAGFVA